MSSRKGSTAMIGAGVVACAACCAAPIAGVLAAIGLGTVLGVALWGIGGLLVAVVGLLFVARRRRRASECAAPAPTVAVTAPKVRPSR